MKILSPRLVSLSAAICTFAFTTTSSFAQIWNFDADAQGWSVYNSPGQGDYTNNGSFPVIWTAVGGNPGGFINRPDPAAGTFLFQAPISDANYANYIGGQLTFSLQTSLTPAFALDSLVLFRSNTSGLTIVTPLGYQPGTSWTDYALNLSAPNFRYDNLLGGVVSAADFATVMSDIDLFLINGEYFTGVNETTGLDSVAFRAVPEPSTYGLLGAVALLGLALYRRSIRKLK